MEYAIELLRAEHKAMQTLVKDKNLMITDIAKARTCMSAVNQLKRAIKILEGKIRV